MLNTTTKRGRPQSVYRTSWGEQVPGLRRLKDGRWRTSWPVQTTFSEPDERVAVVRYRQLQANRQGATVSVPLAAARITDGAAVRAAIQSLPAPAEDLTRLTGTFLPAALLTPPEPTPDAPARIVLEGDVIQFFREPVQASGFWLWLRHLILHQPKYVAQQTGIEQIGYLAELVRPEPSPTLDQLIETYAAKPGVTSEEVQRCKRFWAEFQKIVSVPTIRDLKREHVEAYESAVNEMKLSAKSVKHRYSRIRTVIAYSVRRGKGQKDCRAALDLLAMLEAERTTSLDPQPIDARDFWAVYNAAVKADDLTFAAMLLFALNCALYSSEVGSVRWSEIDLKRGEYVSRRKKTGIVRVAVLWPETVKALTKLPRGRETVFNTRFQAYKRFSVFRDWTIHRKAAGVKEGITFAQVRDGAFTAACRVSLDEARVLAGHKFGGATDAYVARNPQFVAKACRAVYDTYFSPVG